MGIRPVPASGLLGWADRAKAAWSFGAVEAGRGHIVTPQASDSDAPLPEAEQLAAARRGSAEALGQSLEICRRYLLQIAASELASHLQPKIAASDVVQETFL